MAQISEAFFKGGRRYSISVPFALLARWNSNHAQGDEAEVKFIEEFMDDSITNYEIEFTPGRLAGSIDNAVVEEELVKNGRSDRAFMNFLEKIGGADRPDGDANVWVPKNEARFKRYYVHAVNDEVINTDYAEDDELRRWLDDNYGGQFHRFEQAIEDSLSPLDFDDLSESEVEEALQKLGEEIASDAKDRFFDGRPVTSFKFVSADTDNKTMVFEVECSEKLSEESLAKLVHDINNWCENYDDQETEIGFADGMLELWIAMGAASVAKGYHRTKKALVAKQQNTDSELSTRVKKFKNKAVSVINPFKNKAMSVINPVINKAKKGAGKMLRRAASAMGESDIEAEADRYIADPLFEGPTTLPDEPVVAPDTDDPGIADPDEPVKPSKPAKPAPETNPFKRPRINPGEEPRPKAYSPAMEGLERFVTEGSDFAPFLNVRNRGRKRKLKRRVNESVSGSHTTESGIVITVYADDPTEIEANVFVPAELAATEDEAMTVAESADTNGLMTPDFTFERVEKAEGGWDVYYSCCAECQEDHSDDDDAFYGDDDGMPGMRESRRPGTPRRSLTEALDVKGACRVCHDSGCVVAELDKIKALEDGATVTITTNNGSVKICREGDQYHVGQVVSKHDLTLESTLGTSGEEAPSWSMEIDNEMVKITFDEVLDYIKKNNIPVTTIPVKDVFQFCAHKNKTDKETLARSERSSLDYPIIVTKMNGKPTMVLDGHHRLLKAKNNNIDKIKAQVIDLNKASREYQEMFT